MTWLELLNQMHWLLEEKSQEELVAETRKAEIVAKGAAGMLATSTASLAPLEFKSKYINNTLLQHLSK